MKLIVAAVLSSFLFSAAPAHAASLGSAWRAASAETDAARTLRIAKNASDRAYRLGMDLEMMRRSAGEAKAVLGQVAADPRRAERLEFLLKFLEDAYAAQGDSDSYILDKVLWLKYELGKPENPELPAVARELVARVKTADAASQTLRAEVDALAAAVAAEPAAGERAAWLSGRLAESAARMEKYSAYLVEKAAVLDKAGPQG